MKPDDSDIFFGRNAVQCVRIGAADLRPGDRVRLRPRVGGDVLDLFLTGKTASIEAIEQDYDNRIHVAVIIDNDPGRDLGFLRQPGHRFFFAPDELEPLSAGE